MGSDSRDQLVSTWWTRRGQQRLWSLQDQCGHGTGPAALGRGRTTSPGGSPGSARAEARLVARAALVMPCSSLEVWRQGVGPWSARTARTGEGGGLRLQASLGAAWGRPGPGGTPRAVAPASAPWPAPDGCGQGLHCDPQRVLGAGIGPAASGAPESLSRQPASSRSLTEATPPHGHRGRRTHGPTEACTVPGPRTKAPDCSRKILPHSQGKAGDSCGPRRLGPEMAWPVDSLTHGTA